jgi:hypothetical protein
MPFLRLLVPALALALAACNQGGHTGPVDPETAREVFPVDLQDGVTTREEVLSLLGNPGASFESSRLWSYALLPGEDGVLKVRSRIRDGDRYLLWEHESHNLILQFEKGILKSHTLLRIN